MPALNREKVSLLNTTRSRHKTRTSTGEQRKSWNFAKDYVLEMPGFIAEELIREGHGGLLEPEPQLGGTGPVIKHQLLNSNHDNSPLHPG